MAHLIERPWTPPVRHPDGSETWKVKRNCNGCRRTLGDVTLAEVDAAIAGWPLPDVRAECGCLGLPYPKDQAFSPDDTDWWLREHEAHPEVTPEQALAAIEAVHRLEVAGAL